jgi:transposase-like protein
MIEALRKVIKRMHYPLEVMLTCVRWYAAYPLSLRHIEEMMQERGVFVDHATVHRWAIKILPVLAAVFRLRKRPVGTSWRMDETYIKVGGEWKYLYRAVDRVGYTIDFLLRAHRDLAGRGVAWNGPSIPTVCPTRSPSTRVAPTRLPFRAFGPTPAQTSSCAR